jgi:N-acetylglucosaminyldiphosphoundecaprenol N-acetyl-beta-D-mannosaminyltransferase
MLPTKRILSIDVSMGAYKEFVDTIMDYGAKRKSSYVCVANVHMLVEAHQHPEFQRVVNNADIVTPDGMPLAKAFAILYKEQQVRVDGMSLLPVLLQRCIDAGQSVFFYGGTQAMLEQTRTYLNNNFPDLNIAGIHAPPFRKLTEKEIEQTAVMITESKANMVFVVLGCPRQEIWMAQMKGRIPAVMIGIGGALPVLIGQKSRAPEWMQRNSLEWLYRLQQEPRRLFKRYYHTNKTFIYLMFKAKFKQPKSVL